MPAMVGERGKMRATETARTVIDPDSTGLYDPSRDQNNKAKKGERERASTAPYGRTALSIPAAPVEPILGAGELAVRAIPPAPGSGRATDRYRSAWIS